MSRSRATTIIVALLTVFGASGCGSMSGNRNPSAEGAAPAKTAENRSPSPRSENRSTASRAETDRRPPEPEPRRATGNRQPLAGPALIEAAAGDISSDYRISPQDVIFVEVFDEEALSRKVRVSESGHVTLFLLGNVRVAGLTPSEAEEKIERQLVNGRFLRDPHVIVTVEEYRRRAVAVTGEVQEPTIVELPPEQEMTILEAISSARGLTRYARKNRIEVIRPGSPEPFVFSFAELKRTTGEDDVFYLQPGDTIYVDEKFW